MATNISHDTVQLAFQQLDAKDQHRLMVEWLKDLYPGSSDTAVPHLCAICHRRELERCGLGTRVGFFLCTADKCLYEICQLCCHKEGIRITYDLDELYKCPLHI